MTSHGSAHILKSLACFIELHPPNRRGALTDNKTHGGTTIFCGFRAVLWFGFQFGSCDIFDEETKFVQ